MRKPKYLKVFLFRLNFPCKKLVLYYNKDFTQIKRNTKPIKTTLESTQLITDQSTKLYTNSAKRNDPKDKQQ